MYWLQSRQACVPFQNPTPCSERQLEYEGSEKLPKLERSFDRLSLQLQKWNVIHYIMTTLVVCLVHQFILPGTTWSSNTRSEDYDMGWTEVGLSVCEQVCRPSKRKFVNYKTAVQVHKTGWPEVGLTPKRRGWGKL